MIRKILTSMIHLRLEYAAVVWLLNVKKDMRKLQRIQRVATKMVPKLRELTYEDRLKEMGLPMLQDRREREDIITLYMIVNGIDKLDKQDLMIMKDETRQMIGHLRVSKESVC